MSEDARCPLCGEPAGLGVHACASAKTVATVPARPSKTGRVHETGPAPGEVLGGRYEILEKVGEGGGGLVYRALDRELDLVVALKILPPGEPPSGLLKRLKREIRITRDIDHPNVSRVFDLGDAEGLMFLTMRWIDGEPLHRRVRRDGPLADADLERLASGLLAALAATHRLGVIHRDVKPANVMVAANGEPVLVDFGIATSEGTSPVAQARLGERITLDGQIPGTPAWMAPEQLRGEPTPPATDLYSFALTLSHAATGEIGRPEHPAAAFARFPRRLRPQLLRCLEADALRRPRDAVALEAALVRDDRRRRLARVGALVAISLALVSTAVGAAVWRSLRSRAQGAPVVSVEPLRNRTRDARLDWLRHGAEALLASGLEASGQVRLAADAASAARAPKVRGAIVKRGADVSLDLVLSAVDGHVLARSRISGAAGEGLFPGVERAVETFLPALGARRGSRARAAAASVRPTHDVLAFVHFARAQDLIRRHEMPAALAELREATRRDASFARAQLQRYVLVAADSHGPRAEANAALEAADRFAASLPPNERELLDAVREAHVGTRPEHFQRLRAYLRSHPPETATYWMASRIASRDAPTFRVILEEWAARLPADPEPHNQLGYLLMTTFEDDAGAEREFREYLRLAPGTPNAYDSYGDFLKEEGRTAEALDAYDHALTIDPRFASSAGGAADAAIRARDLPEAERRLAKARAILAPESRDFPAWVDGYAAVRLLAGDLRGAYRRLGEVENDPAIGSRSYLAKSYRAVLLGLEGDGAQATRVAAEADRLQKLYQGPDAGLASLVPYVEGLAAYRRHDAAALDRAGTALEALAESPGDPDFGARRALLRGLGRVLAGDPSGAAERLASSPGISGAACLAALEHARALVAAGRVSEADAAYDDALHRADAHGSTAEVAYSWRDAVREAADVARRTGDAAKAAALDERLAAVPMASRQSP